MSIEELVSVDETSAVDETSLYYILQVCRIAVDTCPLIHILAKATSSKSLSFLFSSSVFGGRALIAFGNTGIAKPIVDCVSVVLLDDVGRRKKSNKSRFDKLCLHRVSTIL
jgi:hypothetical protein